MHRTFGTIARGCLALGLGVAFSLSASQAADSATNNVVPSAGQTNVPPLPAYSGAFSLTGSPSVTLPPVPSSTSLIWPIPRTTVRRAKVPIPILPGITGVGIVLSPLKPTEIQSVEPNSPADIAGVHRGEIIVGLNGEPADKLSYEELARNIWRSSPAVLEIRTLDGSTKTTTLTPVITRTIRRPQIIASPPGSEGAWLDTRPTPAATPPPPGPSAQKWTPVSSAIISLGLEPLEILSADEMAVLLSNSAQVVLQICGTDRTQTFGPASPQVYRRATHRSPPTISGTLGTATNSPAKP